jgi:hypothetical protein
MRFRLSVLLIFAGVTFAQDRGDQFLEKEGIGFAHLENKEWTKAIAAFEEQIAIYAENPRPYYNIACANALQGQTIGALTWLERSVERGFGDPAHFDTDTDLDSLRELPAFRKLRRKVEANQARFSAIGPTTIPTQDVRPAESVGVILAESYLASLRLLVDERLQEEPNIRAVMFAHYDTQMARYARYIEDNGDARDAHEAGRERVRLASLYRERAQTDEPLRKIATDLVAQTAEQFLARWPGSTHRAEVQFWLAHATPDTTAIPLLRILAADADGTPTGARAAAELALRDPESRAEVYPRFARRYGKTELGKRLIETRLWRVRLEIEGIPDIEFDPPLGNLRTGKIVIAVVIAGQEASIEGLKKHKSARIGLIVVGGTWPDDRPDKKTSRAKDPIAAIRALRVPDAPMFLEFEDGKLRRN